MITGLFLLLVIVAIYCKVRFHQTVSDAYNLSTQTKESVFGCYYESAAQMRSDMSFIQNLWTTDSIQHIPNAEMKAVLTKVSNFFRFQLLLGLLAVGLVILNSYV
jgi:hypothetical protein